MAITVGGNTGRRSRGAPPLAEINVTPFVDVVLVLLIIFMITAHAMESGIEVDVPKTRTVCCYHKGVAHRYDQQGQRDFSGQRSDPTRRSARADT